jgi:tetratricopeptide (TPR) repeat protein
MFLHLHLPEVAHDLLRRSEATKHDPWLVAAEIAIAAHREKAPQLFRQGMSFIEAGKSRPYEINELAAAIGTILIKDGNRKRGRRMFARSLADPSGNTLAQAEWISQSWHERVLEPDVLTGQADANEAKSLHLFNLGEFEQALEFAQRWISEEPFSNRAYVAGVAAGCAAQDYKQTILLADRGLRYEPTSSTILNNKAFALACMGRLDEAERILETIPNEGGLWSLVSEANRGLIAFRRHLNDLGVQQYRVAIAGFHKLNDAGNERIARSFLAREAVLAGDPQAKAFIDEADARIGDASAPQAQKILREAKLAFQASFMRPHRPESS